MDFDMKSLEDYLTDFGNTKKTKLTYYKTFLSQTDYITSKIAEYMYLNKPVEEKYTIILEEREKAREEIRKLIYQ